LVPARVRGLLSDRSGNLIFISDDRGYSVSFFREGNFKTPLFKQYLLRNDVEQFQHLKLRFPIIEKAKCILSLNQTQAIAKTLYLPEAAMENLHQVISFELDRITPFKADQVYFVAIPQGKTGQGQVKVLLVLTPQHILEEQLTFIYAIGVQPSAVEFKPLSDSHPELEYNLLPDLFKPVTNKLGQLLNWVLGLILIVMLLAALIFPVWNESKQVENLKSQLKLIEKQTRVVDDEQLEIDALQDETNRLLNIHDQSPELIEILNELTHILKDDTSLTNLQYSDKHMQIHGQSPAASGLIGLLEADPYFSKASFVSPLTQDKVTGLERFQISVDVSAKPSKPTQAEEVANSPEPAAPAGGHNE